MGVLWCPVEEDAWDSSPAAEFCTSCGVRVPKGNSFCYICGAATRPEAEVCTSCGARLVQVGVSDKSRTSALLLCIFLGTFGAHRFYLGLTGTAVAQLVLMVVGIATSWLIVGIFLMAGAGIWALVDMIMIIAGTLADVNGRPVTTW